MDQRCNFYLFATSIHPKQNLPNLGQLMGVSWFEKAIFRLSNELYYNQVLTTRMERVLVIYNEMFSAPKTAAIVVKKNQDKVLKKNPRKPPQKKF